MYGEDSRATLEGLPEKLRIGVGDKSAIVGDVADLLHVFAQVGNETVESRMKA